MMIKLKVKEGRDKEQRVIERDKYRDNGKAKNGKRQRQKHKGKVNLSENIIKSNKSHVSHKNNFAYIY